MRLVLRTLAPLLVRLASGMHRASDDAGREDLALLPARLDQIDLWIEQGLLNGSELNAADFQIAPNISALLLFEDLVPFIAGRPAEALARRVAPDRRAPRSLTAEEVARALAAARRWGHGVTRSPSLVLSLDLAPTGSIWWGSEHNPP